MVRALACLDSMVVAGHIEAPVGTVYLRCSILEAEDVEVEVAEVMAG